MSFELADWLFKTCVPQKSRILNALHKYTSFKPADWRLGRVHGCAYMERCLHGMIVQNGIWVMLSVFKCISDDELAEKRKFTQQRHNKMLRNAGKRSSKALTMKSG